MKFLTPGLRLLLTIASAFIIIGGLRYASPVIVPVLLAFFMAVLNVPFLQWLGRRGMPHFLAMFTSIFVNLAIIGFFVGLGVHIMLSFLPKAPGYVEDMRQNIQELGDKLFQSTPILNNTGKLQESKETLYEMIRRQANQFTYELPTGNQVLDKVTSLTGLSFLVFIVMIFFMTETQRVESRFSEIKEAQGPDLTMLSRVSKDIQRYLGIKTAVSLVTGLLAWILTWAFNVDFALLWGITAFVLNYIPAIGSIIAAVPPCLLALSQFGAFESSLIGLGYLCINMALGNFIEPMLLGRRFGISTLVVVLSVIFWGWLWGTVGMFLAIPLTMVVKVILDKTEEFRWLSVAMGKSAAEIPQISGWRPAEHDAHDYSDAAEDAKPDHAGSAPL